MGASVEVVGCGGMGGSKGVVLAGGVGCCGASSCPGCGCGLAEV